MTEDAQRTILAGWPPRVDQDPRRLEAYVLLQGGASRSFVCQLDDPDTPCVLIATSVPAGLPDLYHIFMRGGERHS